MRAADGRGVRLTVRGVPLVIRYCTITVAPMLTRL